MPFTEPGAGSMPFQGGASAGAPSLSPFMEPGAGSMPVQGGAPAGAPLPQCAPCGGGECAATGGGPGRHGSVPFGSGSMPAVAVGRPLCSPGALSCGVCAPLRTPWGAVAGRDPVAWPGALSPPAGQGAKPGYMPGSAENHGAPALWTPVPASRCLGFWKAWSGGEAQEGSLLERQGLGAGHQGLKSQYFGVVRV